MNRRIHIKGSVACYLQTVHQRFHLPIAYNNKQRFNSLCGIFLASFLFFGWLLSWQEGLLNVETLESEDELTGVEISCLRLKGQMIYLPEAENILFLCSPRWATVGSLSMINVVSQCPMR